MTAREELKALAARVMTLTGPDRDANKALVPLVGLRLVEEGHPLGSCCYDANGHGVPLPNFTASLDAAMSLVKPEWADSIHLTAFRAIVWDSIARADGDDAVGRMARSVTAAALLARAEQMGELQ